MESPRTITHVHTRACTTHRLTWHKQSTCHMICVHPLTVLILFRRVSLSSHINGQRSPANWTPFDLPSGLIIIFNAHFLAAYQHHAFFVVLRGFCMNWLLMWVSNFTRSPGWVSDFTRKHNRTHWNYIFCVVVIFYYISQTRYIFVIMSLPRKYIYIYIL